MADSGKIIEALIQILALAGIGLFGKALCHFCTYMKDLNRLKKLIIESRPIPPGLWQRMRKREGFRRDEHITGHYLIIASMIYLLKLVVGTNELGLNFFTISIDNNNTRTLIITIIILLGLILGYIVVRLGNIDAHGTKEKIVSKKQFISNKDVAESKKTYKPISKSNKISFIPFSIFHVVNTIGVASLSVSYYIADNLLKFSIPGG